MNIFPPLSNEKRICKETLNKSMIRKGISMQ